KIPHLHVPHGGKRGEGEFATIQRVFDHRRATKSLWTMQVTMDLPEQLARRLGPEMGRLVEIIERGLQQGGGDTSANWREIIAFLARGPRPEEIIGLRPSENHRQRSRELLDKNQQGRLTQPEEGELEGMGQLNFM